ncbi:hypothetical protein SLEP1_g20653 [Rubroshorea leprosula]|uniref:SAC domain-containing protein n=1 Tax=Rubroshorea leprosula TaxID=152421 RepID=A0AAV5J9H5_9ROSI|nr:hypothetical protein SLEP1_g20653 [Rubroshorea leprosula]
MVLNDVETEQIVLEEEAGSCKGKMSSIVQMHGLIPLFWSQEALRFSPKHDIILQRYYPTYEATKLHFEDLAMRYGNPIILLNVIKVRCRRTTVPSMLLLCTLFECLLSLFYIIMHNLLRN